MRILSLIAAIVLLPTTTFAAIAIDSVGTMDQIGSPSNPQTLSFTNTAGTLAVVGVGCRTGGDLVTAVSYGGNAMTLVQKFNSTAASTWIYVYELATPPTGANNISVSHSGCTDIRIAGISYTGTTDIEASNTGTQAASATWTGNVTTLSTDAWVGAFVMNDVTDNAAGGSAVMRTPAFPTGSDGNDPGFLDSNAAQGAPGSKNISGAIVGGSAGTSGWITFSIAPSGGGGGAANPFARGSSWWFAFW